jgi:uncharacterized protein
LVAYGSKPAFKSVLAAAFAELWGPTFDQRGTEEKDEAMQRPEAEAGAATYCLLDTPSPSGTTIAQQFLAKRGTSLTLPERDYLQRLAATRMGLYRIDAVHLDRGLTCVDLWTNEHLEVRERKLTHDVKPSWVIGARTFPAADGATELDGAIYVFSEGKAQEVIDRLRSDWFAAHAAKVELSEALFLKRRFPVLIHQGWFDDEFFGAEGRPERMSGVGVAEPFRRPQRSALRDFRIIDPQLLELATFLHSPCAPTAMTIDRLHGFLCAVNCAPTIMRPQQWMPLVGGNEPLKLESDDHAERIIAAIFAFSNAIVDQLADGTCKPLLPSRPGPDMHNVAQGWCLGFVEGMTLQQRSWDRLINDADAQMMIMPIFVLADPTALVNDPAPDAAATKGMVQLLPTAVAAIGDYWAAEEAQRRAARASRRRSARTPTKGPTDTNSR